MIFNYEYNHAMDRVYNDSPATNPDIEKPLVRISDIGQTITEGKGQGTFMNSLRAAIFRGAGKIELSTQMEGTDQSVGAESYGKEIRQELRDIARVNEVTIHSVHAPTQIGNLSGYGGQQQGFSDEIRNMEREEIKKAIDFAADVAGGGAVVVHTGEFERPMYDAKWNKSNEFQAYPEESEKAMYPLVDKKTGRVVTEIRKNQNFYGPLWKIANNDYIDENGNAIKRGDYIDNNNNKVVNLSKRVPEIDDKGLPKIVPRKWDYFTEEAKIRNEESVQNLGRRLNSGEITTPEEAFIKAQMEGRERIARGYALYYSDRLASEMKAVSQLKEARGEYGKINQNIPREEKQKIAEQIASKYPEAAAMVRPGSSDEDINKAFKHLERSIEMAQQMTTGQLEEAEQSRNQRENFVSAHKYAREKSLQSYAELGIYAMDRTKSGEGRSASHGGVDRDIYIAPENVFPEIGYGSHPEELIELVKDARRKMIEMLTDPYTRTEGGKKIPNPYYRAMSEDEAKKFAQNHIKATLDTQHLGMWYKYFTPKAGETEERRRERFDKWYMEEVKKMDDEKIIGNIHIVDGFGRGHTHLPAGQGNLPIKSAIEYLKKKGYAGAMSSEGYGENATRQLTETWGLFGSPIYGTSFRGPARSWSEVEHSYFSRLQSPYFVFGGYAPSNDWTLWSETPFE